MRGVKLFSRKSRCVRVFENPENSREVTMNVMRFSDGPIGWPDKQTNSSSSSTAVPVPPMTSNAMIDPVTSLPLLLRGPLVLCVALSALVLPYLQLALSTITPSTKLSLLALILGLFLTAADGFSFVQTQYRIHRQTLRNKLDAVVLDDVLRSIFAPDGLVAGWMAGWVGAVTMYGLPLDEDQRVRLFESGLGTDDGRFDARAVLMSPGGWRRLLLPSGWRGEGNDEEERNCTGKENWGKPEKTARTENDLPVLPVGTVTYDEGDSTTVEATDEGSSRSEASYQATSPVSAAAAAPVRRPLHEPSRPQIPYSRQQYSRQQTRRGTANQIPSISPARRPTILRPISSPPEDPITVTASILSQLISRYVDQSLSAIPQHAVQTAAVSSAMALTVQLRRSPVARSALWTVVQGITAVGLAGTAAGAVMVLEAQRRRKANDGTPTGDAPVGGAAPSSSSAASSISTDSHVHDHHSNAAPFPSLSSVLNDGTAYVHSLLTSAKSPAFLRRLVEDETLRRKVQGFVAVLVLFYFRRRRRISMQQPYTSARGL